MWRLLTIAALVFPSARALAVPLELSYGGRLTDNAGTAIAGPVNLRFTFWNDATASAVGNQIFNPMNRLRDSAGTLQAVADTLQGVALSNGVFQTSLYLDAADFHALFPDSGTAPWVQVEQVTVGGGIVTSVIQTFPRQKFATVPYALKVPVDGFGLTYDSSGRLALRRYTAEVTNAGDQSLTNTIWTRLSWDTENEDFGGLHSTSSNTSRFTIPAGAGGLYLVCAAVGFQSNTSGTRWIHLYKNGNPTQSHIANKATHANGAAVVNACWQLRLVATDYVEVWAYQSSGGSLDVHGVTSGTLDSYFRITYLPGQ